jgi:hypothetical protein
MAHTGHTRRSHFLSIRVTLCHGGGFGLRFARGENMPGLCLKCRRMSRCVQLAKPLGN